MNILANRLRESRKNINLTQKELAEKIGVSTSVIGDIESGRRVPSKRTALKLSKLFSTSVEYWKDVNAEKEYIEKRNTYAALDNVIKTLIANNKINIANLDNIDEEIWNIIKSAIKIDLKLMFLKKEGDK